MGRTGGEICHLTFFIGHFTSHFVAIRVVSWIVCLPNIENDPRNFPKGHYKTRLGPRWEMKSSTKNAKQWQMKNVFPLLSSASWLHALTGRVTRCPGPLEVISPEVTGHIHYLADEVKSGHLFGFHCLR